MVAGECRSFGAWAKPITATSVTLSRRSLRSQMVGVGLVRRVGLAGRLEVVDVLASVVPHSSRGFQTALTRMPIRTSSGAQPRIRCWIAMSAPSISTEAATYGAGTRCPWKGTLTTQNVVTMPVSGSSTSSAVGTPSAGQAPRGGR